MRKYEAHEEACKEKGHVRCEVRKARHKNVLVTRKHLDT